MGRTAKVVIGSSCVGMGYYSIKRVVWSKSVIESGFYSGLAGLFVMGAYKFLRDNEVVERLENLLGQEKPEVATRIRGLLCKKVPELEQRAQTGEQYSLQKLKRQIMKERGYIG